MKETNKKGFTLVELMIAIAAASILAGAFISFFLSSQHQYQREQNRVEEMQSLRLVGQLVDHTIRSSSQSLIIEEVGGCYELRESEINEDDDTVVTTRISSYCQNGEVLTIDGLTHIDAIKNFKLVGDPLPVDMQAGDTLKKITLEIEGVLGGSYDKVFVLRNQE